MGLATIKDILGKATTYTPIDFASDLSLVGGVRAKNMGLAAVKGTKEHRLTEKISKTSGAKERR